MVAGEAAGESLDVDIAAERFDDGPGDRVSGDGLGLTGASSGAGEEAPDLDSFAASDVSLADHLLQQAGEVVTGADLFVAQHLIDLIDEAGYLTENLLSVANRLGVPLARIEQVLAVIQAFDPTGVGAVSYTHLTLPPSGLV